MVSDTEGDTVVKPETEDVGATSDAEDVAEKSDSDSDFEAPGRGRKKRKAKSKSAAANKRKSVASSTPKSNKCKLCRQRLDDNPNLVSRLGP